MERARKRISFVIMCSILVCMLTTPAFAGNANFDYSLKNTGRVYQCDTDSKSTKDNSLSYDPQWVINIQDLNFKNCSLSGTLGMAFMPLVYKSSGSGGAGYYQGGNPFWTKSEGRSLVNYNVSGSTTYGAKGNYWLGGRLDDLLSGTATASGLWNADTK